jgi:hypothetical protein
MVIREPDLISREIQDLDKLLSSAKELSLQFPEDNFMNLSISQYEHRKEILLTNLRESMAHYGRHTLKYIFQDVSDKIQLDLMLEGLNSFKKLLDKSLEKVTNGKTNHFPVYFNTVFSGSFGIQLSTPFEQRLLENVYENTLTEILNVMGGLTSDDDSGLREILGGIGDNRKLLHKYSQFFKKIHQTNKSIKIIWDSPITRQNREVIVRPQRAQFLYNYFTQHVKTEETLQLYGIIKGVSLIKYKVEFVVGQDDRDVITAKFDKELSDLIIDSIDKYVIAKYHVSIDINEATEEELKKYTLIEVKSQ